MGAVAVAQRQPIGRRGAADRPHHRRGPRRAGRRHGERAELDLSVSPGSQVMIRWRLRNDPAFGQFVKLDIDTQRQFADVAYRDLRVRIVGARFYDLP